MYFFITIFLLCISPVFAEIDVKLIAKIERYNENIKHADKDILHTQKTIIQLEKDLKKLQTNEITLRRKLVKNVHKFNISTRELSRYARIPQQVQTLKDIFNVDPQRQNILKLGEKSLATTLDKNRTQLNRLLDTYTHKENKQRSLKKQESLLIKKRLKLTKLRQKYLKDLRIQDETLAKKLAAAIKKPLLTPQTSKKELPGKYHDWLPVRGRLIQNYKHKGENGVTATGLTIAATSSAKVLALQKGRVSYSGPFKTYGWLMIIDHGKDINTIYGGLGQTLLNAGDKVNKGTAIATLPNTLKPHLYFEVRHDGESINPTKWIKQQ